MIGHLTDGYPNIGMAWAARRELLEQHGFYDGCVIGGGDSALICAAFGVPEIVMGLHDMAPHSANAISAGHTLYTKTYKAR